MKKLVMILAAVSAAWAQNTVPVPASGNVTLPLDQYNQLVELAGQPPKKPDGPPFRHVLKNAEMNLEVKGESVSGSIVIEGEVLAAGDRKVPLVTGMTVLDAQQSGNPLPLEQDGGTHWALLSGPGEFTVTLQTAMPLGIETGRASFNLPAPAAGAARLTLTVPGSQTLVNLSPGLITRRSSIDGRTTIEATLVPGEIANIWWAARLNTPATPAPPKEVRFLSDVKTLISVSQAELAVAALAEITVVQGEPSQFRIQSPEGYELTGATGPTLVSSDVQGRTILLTVNNPALRSHQFLISLTKDNMSTRTEIPLVTFEGTQRETGEVLVEGEGTMELTATERGGLHRMDFKETSPYLRSLARTTLHAAFRYQKRPAETPAVALEWVRFPETQVLSAVAQEAVVTTLVTSEGRSLTEVKLTLKNKAQPFLKLELPAGASILSADVAGEKVKPVQGADGSRVPLLRPGFRPADSYNISFVFLHAGTPFAKKGGAELTLPKMDIPIGDLQWEVFLPERYKVKDFGGDPVAESLLPRSYQDAAEVPVNNASRLQLPLLALSTGVYSEPIGPGQVGGIIIDPAGAVVGGSSVRVEHLGTSANFGAVTDSRGRWVVSNVPSGRVRITVELAGFKKLVREINHDASRGTQLNLGLEVGSTSESITVTANASTINTETSELSRNVPLNPPQAASANVTDLQRRVAGVLPIAVNVPRTGSSYRFVRPLVIDEETTLTFKYRSR